METLKQKINPDKNALKRFLVSSAARELSSLSEPCYYPKTKKFYFELLHLLKITDKDVKEFVKRTYQGTKAQSWALWKDPGTNILIFIMHYFLEQRDISAYKSTLLYYMIVQYSRLMHKQMKYCDEDAFKYTLDNLTRTHLFFREKTIPGALFFLSSQIENRYTNSFKEWNVDDIIAFISAARHRISQSVKTFAEHYYRHKESGTSIKSQGQIDDEANSYQYTVLNKGERVIDEVVKKITAYKVTDRKAFDEAKTITKVKTSIATLVVDGLGKQQHFNNIKIALQLYVKGAKTVQMVCGDEFYTYVKRLMAVKRINAQLYFKAQIDILMKDILKDTGNLKMYEKYTSQTQFIINSFLAFYLTLMLRRSLCGK